MKSCTLSQFSIETTGIGLSGRTVRLCLGFPGSRYSSVRTDGRVSDVCTGAVGRETASCGMVALSVHGSDCGLVGVFSFAGVEVIAPHDRVLTGLDDENAGQRDQHGEALCLRTQAVASAPQQYRTTSGFKHKSHSPTWGV